MRDVARPIRAILGVAALSLVGFMVLGWVLDYRGGDDPSDVPGIETTQTPAPEGETTGTESSSTEDGASTEGSTASRVVVLVNGLNFRKEPSGGADLIKGLAEGTELELISTEGGWHKVKDSEGTVGYVSSSSQYTRVDQ